jgi:hypothetical protein
MAMDNDQFITNLIAEQMKIGFDLLERRFDSFETEVRPVVRIHGEDIAVLKDNLDTVNRRRFITPTISSASVVGLIEGIKGLLTFMRHP